jgi:hypothetical protein
MCCGRTGSDARSDALGVVTTQPDDLAQAGGVGVATAPGPHRPPTAPAAALARSPFVAAGVAVSLAVVGAWLRWSRLGASSLWVDDAWVAISTRVDGLDDLLRIGFTSPGFLVVLRLWSGLAGETATTLQVLPLALGVVGPPLCFYVARAWGARLGPAVLAGALLAVAPTHRIYSTHVKHYTAEVVMALLLLWGAAAVIREPGDRRRWVALLGGCVAATVVSASEAVVVAGVLAAAYVAAARQERTWLPRLPALVFGGYLVVAAAWHMFVLRPRLNRELYQFWEEAFIQLDKGLDTVPGQVRDRLEAVIAGFTTEDSHVALVLLGVAAAVLLTRRPIAAIALLVPVSVALVLATADVAPLGGGRTDIYLYPAIALLAGLGVDEAVRLFGRTGASLASVVALVAAIAVVARTEPTLRGYHVYPSQDLRPLVNLVERERRPGDITVVYPSASYGYGLYTKYPVRLRLDARTPVSFLVEPQDDRTVVLPMYREHPQRYRQPLSEVVGEHRRIWLIGTHLRADWSVIRRILDEHGYAVAERHVTEGAELLLYRAG